MSQELVSITIVLLVPPRETSTGSATVYQQRIERIPRDVARQITEDLAAFRAEPDDEHRVHVYRISPIDEEEGNDSSLVVLDFANVMSLNVEAPV